MSEWECARCGRWFGSPNRPHVCMPATTVDALFHHRPAGQREIYNAVASHLQSLGPLIIEPVSVGILFKRRRTFVELRPRQKWMNLSFMLDHRVVHPRVSRVISGNGRHFHFTRLGASTDVDEAVREWLTESYFAAE